VAFSIIDLRRAKASIEKEKDLMKKFMMVMLGLAFALNTVAPSFAQEKKDETKKEQKKKKKKKSDEEKK
jgi:hypothetical protein